MRETDTLLPGDRQGRREIPTFWQLVTQGYIVHNTGSTARDHLANERTYLAWIRTALALAGVGIGLLKYADITNSAGYLVITLGIFVLFNSSVRYFHVMVLISDGSFETNVRSVLAFVVMILIVVFTILSLNFAGKL